MGPLRTGQANGDPTGECVISPGRALHFDPETERVIGDDEANNLLRDGDRIIGHRSPCPKKSDAHGPHREARWYVANSEIERASRLVFHSINAGATLIPCCPVGNCFLTAQVGGRKL